MATETIENAPATSEKKKRPRYNVSDIDLVRAYMESGRNPEKAAENLKMSVTALTSRISKLRKTNVSIPKKERKHKEVNVDALNEIIKSFSTENKS